MGLATRTPGLGRLQEKLGWTPKDSTSRGTPGEDPRTQQKDQDGSRPSERTDTRKVTSLDL